MIYIQSLRQADVLDYSFFLSDGLTSINTDKFQIGDTFTLSLDLTDEMGDTIKALGYVDFSVYRLGVGNNDSYRALIKFKIVDKDHHFMYSKDKPNEFRHFSYSMTIRAEHGYWEDLFRWVMEGKRPEWADKTPPKSAQKRTRRVVK